MSTHLPTRPIVRRVRSSRAWSTRAPFPGRTAGLAALTLAVCAGATLAGTPMAMVAETRQAAKAAAAADVSAASYVPDNAIVAMRLLEPDARAETFRKTVERMNFMASPAGIALKNEPGFMQLRVGLAGLAAAADTDSWGAIGSVLGKDAVVALFPGEKSDTNPGSEPELLVVAIARDAAARARFVEAFTSTAGLTKSGKAEAGKSTIVAGMTVFSVAPRLHFGSSGDVLLVSSSMDLIKRSLGDGKGTAKPISGAPAFKAAMEKAPATAAAVMMGDSSLLSKALRDGGQELIDNPLGGLLFGGWMADVLSAKATVAWIEDLKDSLKLSMAVDAGKERPESHRGFLAKFEPPMVQWPGITLPGQMGEIAISRNWSEIFGDREKILTVNGSSQLAGFAGTMTTLMGIDFLEDFLPRVNGPVRLIMSRQGFEGRPVPSPKLPGFALVTPVKGGSEESFRERLFSGGQMAMSFINYESMQKQKLGVVMSIGEHRGIKILRGEYAKPKPGGAGGPASVEYNFEPNSAVVKDYYILATSRAMLTGIIDALLDAKPGAAAGGGGPVPDTINLRGAEALAILHDNREELVTNRMLEHDESRAKAEQTVNGFLAAAKMLDAVEMTSTPSASGHRAEVTVKIKPWTAAKDDGEAAPR